MRVIAPFLLSLILPASIHGQPVNFNDCSRKTISPGVLDREYRFVENLASASIRIKARDRSIAVERITFSSPRRLMILLDVSGSMVQKNKWQVLQVLAHDVVRSAPADVEVALSTFAKEYREIVGYTRDRNVLRSALEALTYETLNARKGAYRTLLADALLTAVRQHSAPSMGDVIYVLTDGDDNRSNSGLGDIRKEFLQRGMRAYFFFIRKQTQSFHYIDSSHFQRLAAASGGYVIDLAASRPNASLAYSSTDFYYELNQENLRDLATGARILYNSMFRFYRLELQIPEELQRRNSKLKLAMVDQRDDKMKNVELLHPQELLRCALCAVKIHPRSVTTPNP